MKDTIGTIFGLMLGCFLVFLGITWPDYLSNFYLYQLKEFETTMATLREQGVAIEEIRALQAEFKNFQDSWMGTIARFADLKSLFIVLGGAYAATMIAFRFSDAMRAVLFVGQAFRQGRREEEFLAVYQTVVNMCEKRTNNELITDEEIEAVKNTDLRTWLQDFIVVDLVSEEMIEEIVRSEIEMYNYRSFEEIDLRASWSWRGDEQDLALGSASFAQTAPRQRWEQRARCGARQPGT